MDLLERTAHLETLGALLCRAEAGHGRLVLLGGEAGVGKTALVRRLCDAVSGDVRVLSGACDALSTPRPLGPLLDIAGEVDGELATLVKAAAPRHQLFSAFLSELDQGRTATLAVIEDVHWADEASLDLLRYLGRRLAATHGLVIATYRDDEIGAKHPLQIVMGDLATATAVVRLSLAPLSVDGVCALAAGSNFDPVALHRQTGGNPFFVTEILAAGSSSIPATVRDAVLARLARLSAASRDVLSAAAVTGSLVEPLLLSSVVDLTGDTVEECLASGMLRVTGNALGFRHELARQAVLAAIVPPVRQELHERVLRALQASPAPDPARLAHHAEEAGDGEAVLNHAPRAAERAAALGAHREAAEQYARALRFADSLPHEQRGALLEGRSYECYLTGQTAAAIAAGEAALDIWRAMGDRLKEGDAQRRLSRLYWVSGSNADAEAAAAAALGLLEALPAGAELAMAYSNQSQLRMLASVSDEAIAWGQKAIALAERFGEVEILAHALLNVGTAKPIDDGEAVDEIERSLSLAREHNLEDHAARAYANLATKFEDSCQYRSAEDILTAGIAYCLEHDLDYMRPYLLARRALALVYLCRWEEASALAESVLGLPHASPASCSVALLALGRMRARRGSPCAGAALDEALALALEIGELQRIGPVRAVRAEAAWLAGDAAGVLTEARDLFELAIRRDHRALAGQLGFWLWRVGDLDIIPPGLCEPFALQIRGDWEAASSRWQELGCQYEAAGALADGDEGARRAAHASLLALGAAPAAAIVARQLRDMGVRGLPRGPRATTRANPARLTQREMEILALLGEGLSNAEIAKRTYVAPKTVTHHVTAILAKLGVRSRMDAARAATKLGLIGETGMSASPN